MNILFFLFFLSYTLSQRLLWFSVTSLLSLLSITVTNHNYFCPQSLRCPRSDWTCLCIDGLNDVCASVCPVVYILQSMHSFGCFCFPLFYISMDFPFNLGQHCGGRQGIDFCPMGLTGTRISPSSWGFTSGCDSAQSIALNLSANLLANQSNLNIILCILSWLKWTFRAPLSQERMEAGKKNLCGAKVQHLDRTKHGNCGRFLSNAEVLPLRHTQRSGCWQVVCCFESGDNCPVPRISKMAFVEDLALHFLTQECIFS